MTTMIDKDIEKLVKIKPFNPKNLGPSSYDLRLSGVVGRYTVPGIKKTEEAKLEYIKFEKAWFLPPWSTDAVVAEYAKEYPDHEILRTPLLGASEEYIELPKNVCASYTGRSSWGRKFLESHMTAGYVDNGFQGTITYEIVAHYPVEVLAGERIGQLTFEKTKVPRVHYGQKADAKYQKQVLPTASMAHLDVDNGDIEYIYVDGSVAANPGEFGIAGMYYKNRAYCYTYMGEKITNNMMELKALQQALHTAKQQLAELPEKDIIIVSDSLLAINGTTGNFNIKAEGIKGIAAENNALYEEIKTHVTLKHVKGHSKDDIIGDIITALSSQYNKSKKLVPNDNTTTIIDMGTLVV